MSKVEIDFSYLNNAIKEDEIKRSKGKKRIDMEEEKKIELLRRDVKILSENKIPLDIKGNQPNSLLFQIDNVEHLNELLDAMEKNNTFKGLLEIRSNKFSDNLGLKLAKIISNNSLRSLIIKNENKPFSDRVACIIGDALENNTSLEQFLCYMDIGEISPIHLIKFLTNSNSRLRVFGYLKITKKLFETFSEYLNKGSRLNVLNFYYKPLEEVNLLYKKEIEQDVLDNLSNKIQTDSYILDVNVTPNPSEFQKDINESLTNDINEIAVSSKLIEKIGGNFDVFQTPLLISTVSKENQISGNKIQREFITDNLKVVGVVKDNYASIYHNCLWSVVYYQVRLGFSAFDLTNNCMAFQIDNTDHLKLLSKEFETRFPNYEISYPMDDAIKSVNQVASYVGVALLIFSITTIIISIFIIILTTFLHLHDNRKDIALARCLGINKKEASKFVVYHLLIQCLFSFIISCIELFLVSIVINYFFTNKLIISFNYRAPLLMLGIDIFVCFISAIFVLKPTLKVEPIEALKK